MGNINGEGNMDLTSIERTRLIRVLISRVKSLEMTIVEILQTPSKEDFNKYTSFKAMAKLYNELVEESDSADQKKIEVFTMNDTQSSFSTSEELRKRIEHFSFNYYGNGQYVNIRQHDDEEIYWVRILDRPFTREFAFSNYNSNLSLRFYFANNKGQGNTLYNGQYGLKILRTSSITLDDYTLEIKVLPTFKISNPWGRYIFDVNIHTLERDMIIQLFDKFAGRRHSIDNQAFINSLKKYPSIIDVNEFIENFNNSFLGSGGPHDYLVSLSIGVFITFPLDLLRTIELNSDESGNDKLVAFVKKIEEKILKFA